MSLTPKQSRLAGMLKRCVEAPSLDVQVAIGRSIRRHFPPDRHVHDYIRVLLVPELPHLAKAQIIDGLRRNKLRRNRMAIQALSHYIRDERQRLYLRTSAVLCLIRFDLKAARSAVEASMPQLLPLIKDEERNPSEDTDSVLFS